MAPEDAQEPRFDSPPRAEVLAEDGEGVAAEQNRGDREPGEQQPPAHLDDGRRHLEDRVVAALGLTVLPRGQGRLLKWGAFIVTHLPASQVLQIACPWHARNQATGCKKAVTCRAAITEIQDHVRTVIQLIFWARAARDYDRQKWHLIHPLAAELPTIEVLRTYLPGMSEEPMPGSIRNDLELERLAERAAAKGKARPKAKARRDLDDDGNVVAAKAKPKAQPKAARKAKAKAKAASGSSASSSHNNSSSSSSSSSSSGSSSSTSSS